MEQAIKKTPLFISWLTCEILQNNYRGEYSLLNIVRKHFARGLLLKRIHLYIYLPFFDSSPSLCIFALGADDCKQQYKW